MKQEHCDSKISPTLFSGEGYHTEPTNISKTFYRERSSHHLPCDSEIKSYPVVGNIHPKVDWTWLAKLTISPPRKKRNGIGFVQSEKQALTGSAILLLALLLLIVRPLNTSHVLLSLDVPYSASWSLAGALDQSCTPAGLEGSSPQNSSGICTDAHLLPERALLYSHKLKWLSWAPSDTLRPPEEHTMLLLCVAYLSSARKALPCPTLSVGTAVLSGPRHLLNPNPGLRILWSDSRNGLGNILNAEWPAGKSAHRGPKICRFIACKPKSILKKEEIKIDGELGDRKGSQWRLGWLIQLVLL